MGATIISFQVLDIHDYVEHNNKHAPGQKIMAQDDVIAQCLFFW